MQLVTKRKGNASVMLLAGIIAGFVFLIALFAGLGASVEVLSTGIFLFTITIIAVTLILFSSKKK